MLSHSDIARLIMGRIRLVPLEFVPTDHETDLLANAFATLESIHDRVAPQEDSGEIEEAGSLLRQLRAANAQAKVSAEAVEHGAAVLQSLERGGLKLNVRFAEAPIWAASGARDVLIAVRRQLWAAATGGAELQRR